MFKIFSHPTLCTNIVQAFKVDVEWSKQRAACFGHDLWKAHFDYQRGVRPINLDPISCVFTPRVVTWARQRWENFAQREPHNFRLRTLPVRLAEAQAQVRSRLASSCTKDAGNGLNSV